MTLGYYYDLRRKNAGEFHMQCRIKKGLIKGEEQQIIDGLGARAGLLGPPLIHTYNILPPSSGSKSKPSKIPK
jgi:hypothetical protein